MKKVRSLAFIGSLMWYFIWNQNNINNDYTVYHRCCKSINNRTSDCNPFKYDFVYDEDIY